MADTHEISYIGGELDLFALAKNWKDYIKREISRYVTGDVLEVGAGIGATTVVLHDGTARRWVCLEPDERLALRLKARLTSCGGRSATNVIVGSLRTFSDRPSFDCILYIDVLEHIHDDRAQIDAAARLVRSGGHVVILSPAHHWLFSEFDKSIGHFRRYNKAHLRSMMPAVGGRIGPERLVELGSALGKDMIFVLGSRIQQSPGGVVAAMKEFHRVLGE